MISIREICDQAPVDIRSIDETKLGSFPNFHIPIDDYHLPPFRRDRNEHEGSKIDLREEFDAKGFVDIEGNTSGTICIEFTISK